VPQLTRTVWAGLLLTIGIGSPCSSAHEFGSKFVVVADGGGGKSDVTDIGRL